MVKNSIIHPMAKEFQRERCGCNYEPVDDFFKSQWQESSKSWLYLAYRLFMAVFFVIVFFLCLFDGQDINFFFIYLTNWGIIIIMITHIFGAILVSIYHFNPKLTDKLLNMETILSPFRIYWAFFTMAVSLSIMITVLYWPLVYNPEIFPLNTVNILAHACNSGFMLLDLCIVAHPIRLVHIIFPLGFDLIYTIFSLIYQLLGGRNLQDKHYIYETMDWYNPKETIFTIVLALILLVLVFFIVFLISKLRMTLARKFKKSSNEFAEYETQHNIQHVPTSISIVMDQNNYEKPK